MSNTNPQTDAHKYQPADEQNRRRAFSDGVIKNANALKAYAQGSKPVEAQGDELYEILKEISYIGADDIYDRFPKLVDKVEALISKQREQAQQELLTSLIDGYTLSEAGVSKAVYHDEDEEFIPVSRLKKMLARPSHKPDEVVLVRGKTIIGEAPPIPDIADDLDIDHEPDEEDRS